MSSQVRKGEVDPQLLGRLGLTVEAMRKAGEAFDKSRTESRKIGELSREEGGGDKEGAGARPGEQVHDGGSAPAVAGSAQVRSGDLPSDAGRERDVSTYDISPEYRRIVERYRAEISEK